MWDGWNNLQVEWGVKLSHSLAGAAGGIVRGFMVGSGPVAAIASVITGLLTATYMTAPISLAYSKYYDVRLDPNLEHGVAFIIGVTAMLICEAAVRYVQGWINRGPPDPKGDDR